LALWAWSEEEALEKYGEEALEVRFLKHLQHLGKPCRCCSLPLFKLYMTITSAET